MDSLDVHRAKESRERYWPPVADAGTSVPLETNPTPAPIQPLLEDCPLAESDSLKRHDWEIMGTYTQNPLGQAQLYSRLRCKRCGKPVRVWED